MAGLPPPTRQSRSQLGRRHRPPIDRPHPHGRAVELPSLRFPPWSALLSTPPLERQADRASPAIGSMDLSREASPELTAPSPWSLNLLLTPTTSRDGPQACVL